MFEKFGIEAVASFDLAVCGPFLIGGKKSSSSDPTKSDDRTLEGMDMSRNMSVPVLPGTSIKGVFRNAVSWEQIMKNKSSEIKDNYFVTELFGKTDGSSCKSKISFFDAYANAGYRLAIRNSVAINPMAQSVITGALFNTDSMVYGSFASGFKIVNFSDEEMHSVLRVMEKINDGSVRFGGRTSRGFGKMHVENFKLTVTTAFDENLCPIQKTLYSISDAMAYRYSEKRGECI